MVRACQQSHCPCQNILYWKYFINSIFFLRNIVVGVTCSWLQLTTSLHLEFNGMFFVTAMLGLRWWIIAALGSAIFAGIATNCTVSWLQGGSRQFEVVIATIVICKCLGICLLSPGLILVFNMTSIKYLQACQAPSVYYLLAMSFSNSDGLKTNNTR